MMIIGIAIAVGTGFVGGLVLIELYGDQLVRWLRS